MATTRSRSRQRSAEIKRFSLSLSIISRMASTWPCGRDFCVVNRSCGETRGSSRSTRRKVSILSGGQSERLATVRLRVFWPSRQASRRRTAGGELRLGTTSMYMGALDHNNYTLSSINMINYMGAYWRSRDGTMHTFPAVYPRIQPLLLLELRSSATDALKFVLPCDTAESANLMAQWPPFICQQISVSCIPRLISPCLKAGALRRDMVGTQNFQRASAQAARSRTAQSLRRRVSGPWPQK